ncbi:MAG: glutathione S-transferase family protein [Pseudomonadota bacterium]
MPQAIDHLITLYSAPLSMFGMKAEIALLEKGLEAEVITVPFDADDRYRPKHPEVLRVNPKRQVPVLLHGAVEIFDSTQIFEYLEDLRPEPPLWPRGPAARALARQRELMADEVYFPLVIRLMFLNREQEPDAVAAATEGALAFYQRAEQWLEGGDWLCGDYSYADIALYMAALFGERHRAGMTGATPKLLAWRARMTARPAVQPVAARLVRWLRAAGRRVPASLAAF